MLTKGALLPEHLTPWGAAFNTVGKMHVGPVVVTTTPKNMVNGKAASHTDLIHLVCVLHVHLMLLTQQHQLQSSRLRGSAAVTFLIYIQ